MIFLDKERFYMMDELEKLCKLLVIIIGKITKNKGHN
jgi:hypothetical protein